MKEITIKSKIASAKSFIDQLCLMIECPYDKELIEDIKVISPS